MYVAGKPTADCYWIAIGRENGWSFQNAKTGQYLIFTPAKDYTTFTRVTLGKDPDAPEAVWSVGSYGGHFNFGYQDDKTYYWSCSSPIVSGSSSLPSAENVLFDVYDEQGNMLAAPTTTTFSDYIDGLAIDQRLMPYDGLSASFFFPIPATKAGKINFTFRTADSAKYQLNVKSAQGALITDWRQVSPSETHTLELQREGAVVATGKVVFTMMPVFDLTYRGDIAPPMTPDGIIQKPTLPGTVHVLSDVPTQDLTCTTAFRRRGATASNYPKRSLNMKLFRPDGAEMDTTLLGLRNDKSWILDAMSIDVVRMRNRVCFDIWNNYSRLPYDSKYEGRNGTVGRFVELIINGEYAGIYCLTDKIDRQLLNLTKPEVDASDRLLNVRGVLYKSNSWDNTSLSESVLDQTQPMDQESWNNWELQHPDDYPSVAAWTPLRNLYNFSTNYSSNPRAYADKLEEHYYLQNLADFYILVLAFDMVDNGMKNLFLSVKNIQKGLRFVLTPWDMDTSLGGYYDGRFYGGTYENTAVVDARIQKNEPFQSLWTYNGGDFRRLAANRWFKLKKDLKVFAPEGVEARMMGYARLFANSGAWAREYARWSGRDGAPVVKSVLDEVPLIIDWYRKRVAEMDAYFLPHTDDPTAIEQLTATPAAEDNAVYTLDGRRVDYSTAPSGIYLSKGKKLIKAAR